MISGVAVSKIIFVNDYIQFPASVVIGTMMYPILDIIAEIFGKKPYVIAITMRCVCDLIFVVLSIFIIYLPHPLGWTHQKDYEYILGIISIAAIVGIFTMILANTINYVILISLKKIMKSKFFILRSFLSSSVAIFVNAILLITIIYYGRVGLTKSLLYAINTASYELIFLTLFCTITPVFIFIIKKYTSNEDVHHL